jgi:hypothetical protein
LKGFWAVDDFGQIKLNCNPIACVCSPGNHALHPFAVNGASGDFICGLNTLTFTTLNTGGPAGLLVEFTNATALSAPEVDAPSAASTLALVGAALTIMVERRKRA